MATTQDKRFIQIATPFPFDTLLLRSFTVTEKISGLFHIQAEVMADTDKAPIVRDNSIVGEPIGITVDLGDSKTRFFHGIVRRFIRSGAEEKFVSYRLDVVPRLWRLTQTQDSRIYQGKKVPDIVEAVLREQAITDFDLRLDGTYTSWDYCVQYQESHFNFISRLLEQEGIFYFFEHEKEKHTLVLADAPAKIVNCPVKFKGQYTPKAGTGNDKTAGQIMTWENAKEVHPGKFTMRDHNFQLPFQTLEVTESSNEAVNPASTLGENADLEIYDYPGEYSQQFVDPDSRLGDVQNEGTKAVRLRLETEELATNVSYAVSFCSTFAAGFKFTLTDHFNKDFNIDYSIVSVQHAFVQVPDYHADEPVAQPYRNSFTCIPNPVKFRPARSTRKPVMRGPQTAIVVGPDGEEIHCDKFGRVKVQFFWDRVGNSDETSSCWIRVSQPWAGKGWGAITIPRIGQEVIVDFIEGDPDQPIITGRVYNADQTVPYTLPDEQNKTTIKSYSTKGGGGFNEIRFDDTKGSEQVFYHAEKDHHHRIKHNRFEDVKCNAFLIVGASQFEFVGGEKHLHVKKKMFEKIEDELHLHAMDNRFTKIEKQDQRHVVADDGLLVDGSQQIHVKDAYVMKADATYDLTVGANMQQKITGALYTDASIGISLTSNASIYLSGKAGICLECGGSFIYITPAGIVIQGPMVMINSGGSAPPAPVASPATPNDANDPVDPKDPQDAVDAIPGEASTVPKWGRPAPPVTYSPLALALQKAAQCGAATVSK